MIFIFSLMLAFASLGFTSSHPYIESKETPIVRFLKPIHLTEMGPNLENIDCIYVINLDHRPERWERTKRLFNERGCYPNRVSAVNGWDLSSNMIKKLSGPYSDKKFKGGVAGCLLSHVSIYKDAYERGFNTVWICEDDIEFAQDIKKISQIVTDVFDIDPDWDLVYTDYDRSIDQRQIRRPGQPRYELIQHDNSKPIFRMNARPQTHSMLFSRKGLKKVLDYFTHVYLWCPIDLDIHNVPGIREYTVSEDIVTFIKGATYSDTDKKRKL